MSGAPPEAPASREPIGPVTSAERIDALDVLQRYERWRRFDTVQMGVTTDVLNRLFSNDLGPVRAVRDIGLGLVERMPGLKEFFIRQASGLSGDTPRLLRGEAI